MRKTFFILFILFGIISVNAQTAENPFAKYGFKNVRAYSFSKGEFEEFHDNKEIVEIGSVLFNTQTNEVVGYISEDTENEVDAATSAMTVDPLCEKYPWISPYAYCLNNPIKYIDPDGREVRIANNTAGALNNLARIAATSHGQTVLNRLIGSQNTYTTNSVFWTGSSKYKDQTINFVGNTWYSNIDGGSASNEVIMGHETYHAFQDDTHQIHWYKGEIGNGLQMEQGAVGFENYLRGVYGDSPMRQQYSGLIGGQKGSFKPNYFSRDGESVSNFTSLGNNEKKTSFGFSYDKKTSKSETQKYYIVVNSDENKKFSYQIYTSEEEYKKATSNW